MAELARAGTRMGTGMSHPSVPITASLAAGEREGGRRHEAHQHAQSLEGEESGDMKQGEEMKGEQGDENPNCCLVAGKC